MSDEKINTDYQNGTTTTTTTSSNSTSDGTTTSNDVQQTINETSELTNSNKNLLLNVVESTTTTTTNQLNKTISSITTFIKLENNVEFNNNGKFLNNDLNIDLELNELDKQISNMSFLLAIFDNIVGPKIVHFWTTKNDKTNVNEHADEQHNNDAKHNKASSKSYNLNDQLLKYIAIHTLNGELYQDKLINHLKFRLYLIKEIGYVIFSVFFDANTVCSSSYGTSIRYANNNLNGTDCSETSSYGGSGGGGNGDNSYSPDSSISSLNASSFKNNSSKKTKSNKTTNTNKNLVSTTLNCFSLIVPFENKDVLFDHYGDSTKFFMNSFENFIIEYKVNAQVKPKVNNITTAIEDLTRSIKKFCSNLNTLRTRGIYPNHFDFQLKIPYRIHIIETYLNDCYFTTPTYSPINNDFLVNAISSHIITNFNTIVIGKTSATINKMINTLAIFMPKEKLKVSCYALEDYSLLSPYFCLQGFVTEKPEDLNLTFDADFLFKKDSPTTIIDLSFKQVYRTSILNEFFVIKENFIQKKIQFLYNSLTLNDLNEVYPVNNYLHWISSPVASQKATIITSMLKQMDVLESEFGVKDSFADLVQKDFYLLALTLIEYLNNEIINNTNKKEKQTKLSIKKICKDLDIKTDEDLNLIIAYANYLKPGFTSNLLFQT